MKYLGIVCAILFAGSMAAQQSAAPACSDTVAIVNGENLSAAELEQTQSKLLQARYTFYHAERKALDDLVDEKLLEMEARHRNITKEELLKQEVDSKVTDPTEDQLEVYYEGTGSEQPFAAVRQKILESIRDLRTTKYREAYLQTLRAQADIKITLAPPQTEVALTKDDAMQGSAQAPVKLIEFADYECPYCQKVAADVKRLKAEYGDRLTLVYKDFPLPMHPHAQKAAEAARCAGVQGRYWDFHDQIFTDKQLDVVQLKDAAKRLNLDSTAFDRCLDSGEQAAAVGKDRSQGIAMGLTGTPSFFVNGHFFSGAVDYYTLKASIEQQLANSTVASRSESQPAAASSPR